MAAITDKASFLSTAAQTPEEVEIKAMGKTVYIRKLTGADMEQVMRAAKAQGNTDGPGLDEMALVVQRGVCGANGDLFFSKDDLDSIKSLPMAALLELSEAVQKCSGLSDEADDATKN